MRVNNYATADNGDDMILVINDIGDFIDRNVIVICNELMVSSIVSKGQEGSDNSVREIY